MSSQTLSINEWNSMLYAQKAQQERVRDIGLDIFRRANRYFQHPFSLKYFQDLLMQWSMKAPAFKVEAFRFVDVLPTLTTNEQILAHMREYFLDSGTPIPGWIRLGLKVALNAPGTDGILSTLVRRNVMAMARGFITGQDGPSAFKNLRAIWDRGLCFTVDILGEAAVAESEALDYQKRYMDLIKTLAAQTKTWPQQMILEESPLGHVPRANVSVKCSSLYSQIDPLAFRRSVDAIKNRLRPILQLAMQCGVTVNLDMEQNDFREMFLTVAEELFCEDDLKSYPHFGIVIQAYLKCAEQDLERVIAFCKRRGAPVTVRLVKGAYWDYEVIQATQKGWEIPVFTVKAESDINYEKLSEILLQNHPHVVAAFASHNVRSLSYVMSRAEVLGLPKNAFEVQMLYGMADSFKDAVRKLNYRVREYAPVGEILPGMAYLVRRLLENSSNEGFLKVRYMKPTEAEKFLNEPRVESKPLSLVKSSHNSKNPIENFQNEPFLDFSRAEHRDWIPETLSKLRAQLPLVVNPVIDGQEVEGTPSAQVYNPSDTSEMVTRFTMANQYHADQALVACEKAKLTWGRWSAQKRADVLRVAAKLMRERKHELIAVIVLETGKNFKEADGDVAEAIDFCEYYALEAERLFSPTSLSTLPGESNTYIYRSRGTAVTIAPWNFPLAILTGMTVGPLVCGNPVIMKPAEQSTGISIYLYKILIEAGVPKEAIHLLPGAGEVVGEYLVNHSKTHIITFTGSKAVGLQILRNAFQPLPGQNHIKKVVAELGGKNGLIVDDDADLDEAVQGALHSAFGFQGQKCSACSRIIVVESAYERFKQRFTEALLSMKIGAADELGAKIGPVIDAESKQRLLEVIQNNKKSIVAQLAVPAELKDRGHFVPPTVFESQDFKCELGQKEFFGPLVTLFKVPNFEAAIQALNGVDYALTGGIFSRSPSHIREACERLEAGNIYVNRGITGALVLRQPFGGFKLSGVGGKAGGPDYLLQFVEPVTVTENTMRRGFAPEL